MANIEPAVLQSIERVITITHSPEYPKTFKARDAKPGIYLISGIFRKIEILKANNLVDSKDCMSVSAIIEPSPFSTSISGGTELIPFSEEYHKLYRPKEKEKVEKLLSPKERKIAAKKEKLLNGIKEERAAKIPRSSIIDVELAKVPAGKDPDWNKIADEVIKGGAAEEDARKGIINQSKQRHKWYTVEGKVNPSTKKE